jgi:hypothetical protein
MRPNSSRVVACCDRVPTSAIYIQSSAAPAPGFCDNIQTAYAGGLSLLLTPHIAPHPRQSTHERDRTIIPPPYDYKLGSSKLVDAAWYGKGEEGAWRTVFGRETFYEAWPADTPFINSGLRERSSTTIVSPLQTGKPPSQLFLVRINYSPDLIITKIYNPHFFDPDEAILTHSNAQPIGDGRFRLPLLEQQHYLRLPVPKYYGTLESWLSGRPASLCLAHVVHPRDYTA